MGVGMSEQSFTVEAPGEFQEERRSMELRWSKDGRLQQRVLVLNHRQGETRPYAAQYDWRDVPTEIAP